MKKFIVRLNCKYTIVVEAKSEDEASEKAENEINESGDPNDNWTQAWSAFEIDEYDP